MAVIADDDDNRDDDEDDEFHAMTSQEIDDELAEGDAAEAEQVPYDEEQRACFRLYFDLMSEFVFVVVWLRENVQFIICEIR